MKIHALSFPRIRVLLFLAGLAVGLSAVLAVRCLATHDYFYGLVLPWNLLLGFIPVPLALAVERFALRYRVPRFKLGASLLAWGLFFPNAPYLITDVIHLHKVAGIPIWFDGALLFGYALTGLLAGLLSMYWVHQLGTHFWGARRANGLLAAYIPLAAWGIYLGREVRCNSWDILYRPHYLVWDILTRGLNLRALVLTVEFSLLIGFSYLVVLALIQLHPRQR